MPVNPASLIEKIQTMQPDQLAEVEDFVDFIQLRDLDRALTRDAAADSARTFAAIWSNAEDDAYDAI